MYLRIYVFTCPIWFPYQVIFMSFNSNETGVTKGTATANISGARDLTFAFSWVFGLLDLQFSAWCFECPFVLLHFANITRSSSIYSFWLRFWYLQTFSVSLPVLSWLCNFLKCHLKHCANIILCRTYCTVFSRSRLIASSIELSMPMLLFIFFWQYIVCDCFW